MSKPKPEGCHGKKRPLESLSSLADLNGGVSPISLEAFQDTFPQGEIAHAT